MRSVRLLTFFLDLSISHFCFRFWHYLWITSFPSPGRSLPDFSGGSPFFECLFIFVYFWILVTLWGQTPGMVLLGIRVIEDGPGSRPSGILRTFSRTFLLFVTNLPMGIGSLFSLLSPSGKTLYDCMSQTRVIWDEKPDLTEPARESVMVHFSKTNTSP